MESFIAGLVGSMLVNLKDYRPSSMGILRFDFVNHFAEEQNFIILMGSIHVARTIIVAAIVEPCMVSIPRTIIVAVAIAIAKVGVDGAFIN
jgi:hypothetical protein